MNNADLYSGSSQDWAYGLAGIKYAYTIEQRDTGESKFLLSEDEIIESGEELWAAVKVVARQLILDAKREASDQNKDHPSVETDEAETSEEKDDEKNHSSEETFEDDDKRRK